MSFIRELFYHALSYRRVQRFSALGERRAAAAGTYIRHAIAELRGDRESAPGWDNVAGFRMRHLGATWMHYVYREVFAERDYWFRTEAVAPVIIDGGGNIGMSTLFFKALYPNASISVFEPAPWACAAMEETIRANALEDIVVHNVGLAEHDGELELFHDERDPGALVMSVHPHEALPSSTRVRAVRLSSYVNGPVDYLKLDVEGSEMGVLRDLDAAGKLGLIEQIGMEYHHHMPPDCDTLGECLSLLERNGFGYQVVGKVYTPITPGQFQGLMIHAYRKARH